MQLSFGKSVNLTDGHGEHKGLVREEVGKSGSAKINQAATSAELMANAKNLLYPRQCNPSTSTVSSTMDSSRSSTASLKPKFSGDTKKQSNSPSSFFDRYFLACTCLFGPFFSFFFNNHFFLGLCIV